MLSKVLKKYLLSVVTTNSILSSSTNGHNVSSLNTGAKEDSSCFKGEKISGFDRIERTSKEVEKMTSLTAPKHSKRPQESKGEANMFRLIKLKILTLITIISFLWSGIAINFLQLINYMTLRHVNFLLFTRVNYYLMYSAWAQVVTLFDWFFESTFKVYHAKKDQEDDIFTNHNIFLANHGYELDWVGAWLATDKFGHLASCKAMLKSDLKYIPVVGWSWALSDQLFLDRNWEKDKHKFGRSMDTLLRYRPMVATFFCEGTRFTKDKLAESQRFAAERGIQAPKYHLIPRTKGFVAIVRHIKKRQQEDPNLKVYIYNAQVGFDDDDGALNIGDIVNRGLRPKGHLYFERMSIDDVPGDEEACAKWLYDFYLKKDNLQEHFNKTSTFPGYVDRRFINYKPRLASLANWILWTTYTLACLAYLAFRLYARYGALYVSLVLSAFFMLSYIYLNWIMYQADVDESKSAIKKKAVD